MEVVQVPAGEFNFDSACSSPFITAPSSPQHIAPFFFSAPVSLSPTKTVPSDPQADQNHDQDDILSQDFEFGFSGHHDTAYLSAADDLFDCGRIRPLHPLCSSARSPKRVKSRKSKDKQSDFINAPVLIQEKAKTETSSSSSGHHIRHGSLSPLRVSDIMLEQHDDNAHNNSQQQVSVTDSSLKSYASAIFSFSKTYRKWNLKDFLLFRSASEGRPADKETLKKYAVLTKAAESSFRSTAGSVSARRRKSGSAVSAHELHYTSKRAAAEEMRKKTFLPYRQGLLGCIGGLPADLPLN